MGASSHHPSPALNFGSSTRQVTLARTETTRTGPSAPASCQGRDRMTDGVRIARSDIQVSRRRAAASTVEALMYSLRAGGAALACPHARRRLAELSEAQLHEVCARLQRFRPNIARAWASVEVELLVAIWVDLHG